MTLDLYLEEEMTIEEIRKQVREIKKMSGDPEVAHAREDSLMSDFIRFVANGGPGISDEVAKMARKVLTVKEINFQRYYA